MNGNATSPAPGGWRGIELNNFATATMDYCVVRYGSSSTAQQANLYKNGGGNVNISNSTFSNGAYSGISVISATGTISISSSIIANNATYGIFVFGSGTLPSIKKNQISGSNVGIYAEASANPLIGGSAGNGNDIFNNIAYSVQNASTSPTINATYNWWGSSTAPLLTGLNKVSNYVDSGNFLTASAFSNTAFVPDTAKTTVGTSTLTGTRLTRVFSNPYGQAL